MCISIALAFRWGRSSFLHAPTSAAITDPPGSAALALPGQDTTPTKVYAHNLLLHKGPNFRIYVIWINGHMVRTHPHINPSFDEAESFLLEIERGVIRANIGDIASFLNTSMPKDAPLKNISIQPDGENLKLHGTVHKMFTMPVEVNGTLTPAPEGQLRFHVNKLNVLKVPLKGLLGGFHIELADLAQVKDIPGIRVAGNDIFFDTRRLLPPPHIHGLITAVHVRPPDVEIVYGAAPQDENQLAQWHNFLRLQGGTLDFGKLTMRNVDLTMIDASKDAWFDLDLVNYQAQLVHGYTRMTAQAGLEIYMPDLDEQAPKRMSQSVTLEWLKNRNASLPPDVKFR